MKLGLINSAWAQAGKDTAYGIWMTKEVGFDAIDIFADPLDASAMERKLIRNECDRAGLPIVSVACVAVGADRLQPERAEVPPGPRAGRTWTWPGRSGRGTSCWSSANTSGTARSSRPPSSGPRA